MSENINELVNGVISTEKLQVAEAFKNDAGSPPSSGTVRVDLLRTVSDICSK